MGADKTDGRDIDLLIEGLTEGPAPKAPARPVNRWSNVRLLRPATPAHGPSRAYASSAVSLPEMPDVGRFVTLLAGYFRLPSQLTMVRMWVGLGLVHGAAMTAWPYPRTYFWGLALYLFSLALVLVAGVWGARLSWDARLGGAHVVALGTVFWALFLGCAVVLPLL